MKGYTWMDLGVKSWWENWNFLTSYLCTIMLYVASITLQQYLLLLPLKLSL
jgi:hypothetical protein